MIAADRPCCQPARIARRLAAVLWAGCFLAPTLPAAEPVGIEHFEKHVRPLLATQCFNCHGPKKQSSGLRLDSRSAIVQGGDRGPAAVPGKPDGSLLLQAVRHQGELKMPPEAKLNAQQIEALAEWIKWGLPWPETPPVAQNNKVRHWAFEPIADPPVPVLDGSSNPIDAFVVAKRQAAGLSASPAADPRTFIRRATYDLTGIPPTPEEVREFEQSAVRNPQSAIETLVDRLLASPHYGEQWGRHWLDVARYSDTKGYVYAREERFWVHAWAYRDWVVKAFNDDLPYNRFLLLQLAADQVAPDDRASLAAMGFLTLGRRFLGVTHDIIDDRIDVVTRGTMGLTVACARCHDHKYDPIPTRDYYSLYGVFANCSERVTSIAEPINRDDTWQTFEKGLIERQQKLNDALTKAREEWSQRVRSRVGDYLIAQFELQKYPEEGFDQVFAKDDILPAYVRRWQAYLANAHERRDPIFVPWHAFAEIPADEFPQRAEQATRSLEPAADQINPLVARQFATPPASMAEVCRRYGEVFAEVDRQWQAVKDSQQTLADPAAEPLRQVLYGKHAPCVVPDEPIVHVESFFDLGTCESLWKLQGEVDRWLIRSTVAPAHALYLVDRDQVTPARVFKRGNPKQKGEVVPLQFPEVIAGPQRQPFQHGSGRLELAQAIVDPKNPLTARVIVNRVWMHHFGAGLVRTPSDFGTRAETPSHPELLDWLATRFVEDGWSLKKLHRRIMLSQTYQMSSLPPQSVIRNPQSTDPDNRLLWRMNERRLSFEELRDSLLAAGGKLDLQLGGKPGDSFNLAFNRRTLYGLVDRQFLPSTLRVFDFASPDLHIPQRSETTVPQQALFFLNHPLVIEQAKRLAQRTTMISATEDRVRRMYELAYQRSPTSAQLAAAVSLVDATAQEPAPIVAPTVAAWQYGYGEVHEESGQVRNFKPLPHFNGKAWQGGPQWPDGKLGWVQLTAAGGHAGNDREHAAIRRWTAPASMTVRVSSRLVHDTTAGDGIRGFLVHSRHGVLKTAAVHNSDATFDVPMLEVQGGDTLDFAVDIGGNLNNDQFTWQAEISQLAGDGTLWKSVADFSGPQVNHLGPWEQLAQVLLAANEFLFVD